VDETGDEAQLLLKAANVGIGSNRWSVGKRMQEQFQPDVFLLDDGFQHAKLQRCVDMLLLDGIDPLAGGAPFPLGRLREPVSAMERADIIVITRAGRRRFDGLLQRLPKAPVFLADVGISRWMPDRPPLDSVAAFCGLANPDTFLETLKMSGASVVLSKSFPDHHRYTREELIALTSEAKLRGARSLVTTQKDFVNLPEDAAECVAPLNLYHVEVSLRVRDESAFLAQLDLLLGTSSRSNGGCAPR
jgi:tetraacyldisaccharide 4'-kinase